MNLYYIDLFCGAGGLTTGVIRSGAKVIACINHDPIAIESHKSNHKEVLHFTEDIATFNISPMVALVKKIRREDPDAIICLHGSLECTHFSKAKGGDSRDADSRTLAEHLYRYFEGIDPDYIDIENVVEFMSWGPLRIACSAMHENKCDLKLINAEARIKKQGHPYHLTPASKKNGLYYRRWHQHICDSYGYEYDYRILNAADYGAMTSRVRYFGQFKKPHLPWTWPEPTHTKDPEKSGGGIGQRLEKWKPVKPALDLSEKGKSIFGRKKPLSENTLRRIYAGLVKHVGEGKEPEFITKWMSGNSTNKSVNDPMITITTMNHLGIIQTDYLLDFYSKGGVKGLDGPIGAILTKDKFATVFLSKYYVGDQHHSKKVDGPLDSITTKDHHSLVFLAKYNGNGHNMTKADEPAATIVAADTFSLVWLDKQFRSEYNHQGIDKPAGSILSNDKHCKITAILVNNYSGGGQHSSVDNPAGSVTTVPKSNLVSLEAWLMNHNFDNIGQDLEKPAPTLLASRKHYYLVNPQYGNKGQDINRPCFTLIAHMDKKPPYLVETENTKKEGIPCILIYPEDSEIMIKIKLFMASHGIMDIKMRMLFVQELLRIQGFGDKYILKGTQTDQKRFIGNAIEVTLAKAHASARRSILQRFKTKDKVA